MVEVFRVSDLEEKNYDESLRVLKAFWKVKKFKSIPVERVREVLSDIGFDTPLEGESVLVGKKKIRGRVFEFIAKDEEDVDPVVVVSDGGVFTKIRSRRKKSGGRKGRVSGVVIEEIQKILAEQDEIRLGDLWKIVKERGLIKNRPHLYNVVVKNCEIKYIENGKRKEIVITGIKA